MCVRLKPVANVGKVIRNRSAPEGNPLRTSVLEPKFGQRLHFEPEHPRQLVRAHELKWNTVLHCVYSTPVISGRHEAGTLPVLEGR